MAAAGSTSQSPQSSSSAETDEARLTCFHEVLRAQGLVEHQKSGFQYFLDEYLPRILMEQNHTPLDRGGCRGYLRVSDVTYGQPCFRENYGEYHPLHPAQARIRGLTYDFAVKVNISLSVEVPVESGAGAAAEAVVLEEVASQRQTTLCHIPAMVGTSVCNLRLSDQVQGECLTDEGGYFIVHGIERVLLCQEKLRTNMPLVFLGKRADREELICEVRSCHERKLRSTSTLYLNLSFDRRVDEVPTITVTLPFLTAAVPLLDMFRLLGVWEEEEMVQHMVRGSQCTDAVRHTVSKLAAAMRPCPWEGEDQLMQFYGVPYKASMDLSRRRRYMHHILCNEFLPHIGMANSPDQLHLKAAFLGMMVQKLLRVHANELPHDDRDHYRNKRVDTPGQLMSLLFRQLFRSAIKAAAGQLIKLMDNYRDTGKPQQLPEDALGGRKISNHLRYAVATGVWAQFRNSNVSSSLQQGVSQILGRMTPVAALANLRRTNTPINREGKQPKPRQLHESSWGLTCPAETPEGPSCGLVNNLSVLTRVRTPTRSDLIIAEVLAQLCPERELRPLMESREELDGHFLMVNGQLVGMVPRGHLEAVAGRLRHMRRCLTLPWDVSIAIDRSWGVLQISSDSGCLMRPLLRADRLDAMLVACRWRAAKPQVRAQAFLLKLVQEGILEFLDKDEESNALVALTPAALAEGTRDYTHVELDPSCILGVCALLIPFCQHNQAPRNCYQAAMCKQAVGVVGSHMFRMETQSFTMAYVQTPLVGTWGEAEVSPFLPAGHQVVCAIMCYTGFNQEDSVILSQGALDRGLFRCWSYTTRKEEENTGTADVERIEKPGQKATVGMRVGCYDKLDDTGVVKLGTQVVVGDVIIGKTALVASDNVPEAINASRSAKKQSVCRDRSVMLRHMNDQGRVDSRFECVNYNNNRRVSVKVRKLRVPEVGDKVSSRHGQKGIIGRILPEAQMPFTLEGVIPDIIVNPHAIPSRMTVGQLIEIIAGKAATADVEPTDGTPFASSADGVEQDIIASIGKALKRSGWVGDGAEHMVSGITGELMDGRVFVGPCFYQRLKHMTQEKVHHRSQGARSVLTRQPVEGRAKEGGLRFGEMERDAVISHGCANVLLDRLNEQSDQFDMTVCSRCGRLATPCTEAMAVVRGKISRCAVCSLNDSARNIPTCYGIKLLAQELGGAMIDTRFELQQQPT